MPKPPESIISAHLRQNGGATEATLRHVLDTFQVAETDAEGRARIADKLAAEGIEAQPPLGRLNGDDTLVLRLAEPDFGPSPEDDRPARKPDRRLAAAAIIAVLAVAGAAGGYLLGKSTGEDLDAARAAGEREGQRQGAARGAEEGYDQGFTAGRKAGYKETYRKTYDRTYEAELKKAGLSPEAVGSDR